MSSLLVFLELLTQYFMSIFLIDISFLFLNLLYFIFFILLAMYLTKFC